MTTCRPRGHGADGDRPMSLLPLPLHRIAKRGPASLPAPQPPENHPPSVLSSALLKLALPFHRPCAPRVHRALAASCNPLHGPVHCAQGPAATALASGPKATAAHRDRAGHPSLPTPRSYASTVRDRWGGGLHCSSTAPRVACSPKGARQRGGRHYRPRYTPRAVRYAPGRQWGAHIVTRTDHTQTHAAVASTRCCKTSS